MSSRGGSTELPPPPPPPLDNIVGSKRLIDQEGLTLETAA